jgi:protein-tyrosine phosphatase
MSMRDEPFNLRDLGGHPTGDGGTVRSGLVYRAASVHRFGGAALPRIRTLIDLRSPQELAREGECPAFHGATVLHRPVLTELWGQIPYEDGAPIEDFLADRYLDMLESGAPAIRDVMFTLAREEDLPAVFFCAAGKDRTGVVTALVLSLLGVPDERIAGDYELSEAPVKAMAAELRGGADGESSAVALAAVAFLQAPRAGMLLFLERLREEHGSAHDYAVDTGVDRATLDALRERLVAY